ncbi:MAG TPA: ATP-binding cassette domain-containing protein [Desulfuromonadaceae bacterium]|jgi:tungstate transport system ATP-binding protein
MAAQFNLTSIQKRYGNKIALELEELTLWPGHLYILTGPNGSGKSTLLNILALLTKPEQGEMAFTGERVTWKNRELNLMRKKVTLLHQSPYLFAGTVSANVAFGLKARGLSGEELQRTVAESLELVGLKGFEERNVRQLSGGEARRVALARAVALKPEMLLLDEPLANMDQESAQVVEQLIASLPDRGTTVVMSTHDPRLNERLEGDVIQLMGGRLASENGRYPAYSSGDQNPGTLKTMLMADALVMLEG